MKTMSGFTIVELLIVVTVMGILGAVVFVAFNGVQDGARATKVISAVDMIEKGLRMYVAEHGHYPIPTDITTPHNNTFLCVQPTSGGWPLADNLSASQCSSPSSDPDASQYAYSQAVITALKTKLGSIPDTSDIVISDGGHSLRGVMYTYMSGPVAELGYPQGLAYLMYYMRGEQTCGRGVGGVDTFGSLTATLCMITLD